MPETIQSAGSVGVDREFDTLWARVKTLENALKSLTTGVSSRQKAQGVVQSVPGTILVQESDGDPSVTVQGLTFDPGTVTEVDGMARITGINGLKARKNSGGADTALRPRLNVIEGAGVTLTVADDGVDNEIDLTVANAGVTSLKKRTSGGVDGTAMSGDVALVEGANITLTEDTVNKRITIAAAGGGSSGLTWAKYTINYTDFTGAGAVASAYFTYLTLAAKQIVHAVAYRLVTAFAAPSLSAANLVGQDDITGFSLNVFALPNQGTSGAASGDTYMNKGVVPSFTGSTTERVQLTLTGNTCNNLTAGQIELWILTSTLP